VAEYNLEQVKAAAQKLDIEYRGRKVGNNIADLGYDLGHVARCLCQLSSSDFHKTHSYVDQPSDDAYICHYKMDPDEDQIDELYIKFCLIEGYLVIDLASFHLP
jgi:hypothetical protein